MIVEEGSPGTLMRIAVTEPAILGTVVDAREHDDGRGRRQREREWQQQRDRGQRTQAGQHTNRRPEQRASETREQVGGCERRREAKRKMFGRDHVRNL